MLPTFAPIQRADAIVVLGNHPPADDDGNVMPETQRRVEAGVAAFDSGLAPLLVMTGGQLGKWVEAEVMRDLAVKLGVSRDAILLETKSDTTISNARYAIELLRGRLMRKEVSVIVVSSPYHLARAGRLFECTGAAVQLAPAEVPESAMYRLRFTINEYWVRVLYWFVDECAEVRGDSRRDGYRF